MIVIRSNTNSEEEFLNGLFLEHKIEFKKERIATFSINFVISKKDFNYIRIVKNNNFWLAYNVFYDFYVLYLNYTKEDVTYYYKNVI